VQVVRSETNEGDEADRATDLVFRSLKRRQACPIIAPARM
jgi:hypothetical protein